VSHHPEVEVLEILEHDPEVVKLLKTVVHELRESRFEQIAALHELREIRRELVHPFPSTIVFKELTVNPTQAGQTQVFTGVLVPAGATYPADTTFTLTSNDPAVFPTLDASGLVVSVTYPQGWSESPTTPLAFSYGAASVSANGSLSSVITPSAPVSAFPTGINWTETT